MEKSKANILLEKGYLILRSQWNQRKGKWKIAKKTAGGWAEWSFSNYDSRESCDEMIDSLISLPDKVVKEEMVDKIADRLTMNN